MLLGLLLIVVALNFLVTSQASVRDPAFPLDPVASVACGAGVIAVGGVLILSTYGRRRKVRAARRQ
jgi:hypothetical protein